MFDTTSCEWFSATAFFYEEWDHPLSLGRHIVLAAKRQVSTAPLAQRLGIRHALGEDGWNSSLDTTSYRQIREAVLRSVVDARLNLVFVHWNVPHLPVIYDAAKDDFSTNSTNTYVDNLKLVDRTARDIRLTLENAGLWDSSTILMTSDHPLRGYNIRQSMMGPPQGTYTQAPTVPFLLKMAGQKRGITYDSPMQTVVTKDLLLAIMKGEITQPEQVAAWLNTHPPRQ
jgi:hypothetical protein